MCLGRPISGYRPLASPAARQARSASRSALRDYGACYGVPGRDMGSSPPRSFSFCVRSCTLHIAVQNVAVCVFHPALNILQCCMLRCAYISCQELGVSCGFLRLRCNVPAIASRAGPGLTASPEGQARVRVRKCMHARVHPADPRVCIACTHRCARGSTRRPPRSPSRRLTMPSATRRRGSATRDAARSVAAEREVV